MIGKATRRADGVKKIRGTLRYTADLVYEGLLHAAIVRPPLARGRLSKIERGPGVDWSRVAFATAADIPGSRYVRMIQNDMPFLASDEVLYKGEPVALVAAETPQLAEAARRAVIVEMEPAQQSPLLTIEHLVALHQSDRNGLETLSRWDLGHGDPHAAIAAADIVVEACYTTPHQEQAYLETNAMTAIPEPDGRLRVEGSLQCPYYVAPAVAEMLASDLDHVHVLALPMGGAFGGKEDFPSLIGGHVALLAQLTGRPVRLVLQRAEDIATSTKRHPAWVKIRAGASSDGKLLGAVIDIVFDGGAYATMSPVVLSRGAIHAGGAYRWPAIRIESVAYRSHTPPNGAFRGFGVPQTAFAIESHIDAMAAACGLDPLSFRLKNCLQTGDVTATSQVLHDDVGARLALEVPARKPTMSKRGRASRPNEATPRRRPGQPANTPIRGIGLSLFWHGAGFTGAGEARIAAKVALDLRADGLAHIRVSSTEMGQGSHTVLSQIVAEALGGTLDEVAVDPVDTAFVPNSGPTVASRTTMIVGGELLRCAQQARQWLASTTSTDEAAHGAKAAAEPGRLGEQIRQALELVGCDQQVFESQHSPASHLVWDEQKHEGDAYATYAWGAAVAEVEIDRLSLEVQVPRITIAIDVGRAVNPQLALGQIEGGILQALGYALCEQVGVKPDGALLRDRFQTYILPTTLDAPRIDVHMLELPYERGPGGAKGLGEMPMNGGAPAVANAIADALSVRVRDLPLTPERLYEALRGLPPDSVARAREISS